VANRVDGAHYWKAYTQIKQKQIADAFGTLEAMQKKFPASRWLKDAKALEVEARQASGQSVSPEAQADEELKLLALRGLMQSDPDRGVPMIEQLLSGNSSVRVKENALFVLSQSRTGRAREIILGVAKGGGNPDLQLRAVRYLGAMGGPENRQILEEVYRSSTDVAVKRAVIRSFQPSGDRARLLSIAKSESSPELRSEAIQQLGAMRATTELSDLYGSETSVEIKRRIIQSLMVGQAVDKLYELARTEKDAQLRRSAVRNLGVMNAAKTGELLRSLYGSETDPEIKREIISALANQRNSTTLVELAKGEKDPALRREFVSRLANMRDKVAMDYLLEILK
jgi:HEAT repeat protein